MAEIASNEELLIENKELKAKINKLEKQLKASNKRTSFYERKSYIYKKRMIDYIEETMQLSVMDEFEFYKNIKVTAENYKLDMDVLYHLIPIWFDRSDSNYERSQADDYEECMIEIMGRQKYDAELEFTSEEMNIMNRTPDLEEMNKIIYDYINTNIHKINTSDK